MGERLLFVTDVLHPCEPSTVVSTSRVTLDDDGAGA